MKFNRTYSLKLEVAGGQNVELAPPFTLDFSVSRQYLAAAQTAQFRVINLGEPTRNLIYKDRWNETERRNIQFRAGYEGDARNGFIALCFNGTIREANSYRQGTEFQTMIDAYDGGFAMVNGFSSASYAAGESYAELMRKLSKDLPGASENPIIGDFPTITRRGFVVMGNTWNYITQLSAGQAIIDNSQLKVLNENEAVTGDVRVITSDSGLLESPRRTNNMIELQMLFEPRLSIGQVVVLDSQTNRLFNGTYKVMGFTHRGTISPAVGGDCRTTVTLWKGTAAITTLPGRLVQ